jgi:hypothetical protein
MVLSAARRSVGRVVPVDAAPVVQWMTSAAPRPGKLNPAPFWAQRPATAGWPALRPLVRGSRAVILVPSFLRLLRFVRAGEVWLRWIPV